MNQPHSTPPKTRHWVYVRLSVLNSLEYKLVCENPENCQEAREDARTPGCGLADLWRDLNVDCLRPPDEQPTEVFRFEVVATHDGHGMEKEWWLEPLDPRAHRTSLQILGMDTWAKFVPPGVAQDEKVRYAVGMAISAVLDQILTPLKEPRNDR